jgi:putative aminopeptidase FrvX
VVDGADRLVDVLRELTLCDGVPGQEGAVRAVMARHLGPYGELERDGLGSLCCLRRGTADRPRVMLAAHMDEIGFIVSDITDEGFLRFQTVGGWWEQVMLAQRVTVHTRQGPIPGVVGSKPPHVLSPEDRRKPVERKDMFVDIGASSRAEAAEWGVRIGDMIVPVCPFQPMRNPQFLMGKAMDDRAGCAVLVEVVRRLAGGGGEAVPHPNTVLAVATVQEEVGLRGADVAARTWQPDVAFALDVGIAGDTPGMRREEARCRLGQGPLLLAYDASLLPNPKLRDFVADVAAAEGIPIQWETVPGGGTDAGRMQFAGTGVPSLVVGFATRYIHSAAAVIHRGDLEAAVQLLVAVLRRLDQAAVDAIRP